MYGRLLGQPEGTTGTNKRPFFNEVLCMAELIKISYEKSPFGFGKSEKVEMKGIKFDKGKVVWLDTSDTVQVRTNMGVVKSEMPNAIIEVVEE